MRIDNVVRGLEPALQHESPHLPRPRHCPTQRLTLVPLCTGATCGEIPGCGDFSVSRLLPRPRHLRHDFTLDRTAELGRAMDEARAARGVYVARYPFMRWSLDCEERVTGVLL
jgi:hypothetical protein